MEDYKIDFVIPWVDGNDPEWMAEKEEYWIKEGNTPYLDGNKDARFRDWNLLKYWFRGVEEYAPWVNKVYFITWGHIPEWLNTDNQKLVVIKHSDYIPKEYLPVFSANPIEINFHRIEGLSEHFVYFNDDMFLINKVDKEDFFVKGLPREMAALYMLTNNGSDDTFQYMLFHMMGEINKRFDLKDCFRKNIGKWLNTKYKKQILNNLLLLRYRNVSGLYTPHVPSSIRKTTMNEVWAEMEKSMKATCTHRFRNPMDVTQYIFRYWSIMKGEFEPSNIIDYGKEFFVFDSNNEKLIETILNQRAKMICINDSIQLKEFTKVRDQVAICFESILPCKSTFERW